MKAPNGSGLARPVDLGHLRASQEEADSIREMASLTERSVNSYILWLHAEFLKTQEVKK